MATTIRRAPHARYSADKLENGKIEVIAKPGLLEHAAQVDTEEQAIRWLCDRGLRKARSRQLLAAELRGEGRFADRRGKT
jgi:hypothetical protein